MTAGNYFGEMEGEACNRDGCKGIIKERPVENCSCHIAPPCSACTTPREYCPECDWEATDEPLNDFLVKSDPETGVYKSWKPRPLDPTKLDYHSKSHTHSSMIKEGVYPPNMTLEDVLKVVNGTFGGRFEYFANGRFKFIAYTD